jgi:hypothetical protein
MNSTKYLSERFQFLTNPKINEHDSEYNELTDSRFEVRASEEHNQTSESLMYLMYSQENETLFI